MRHFPAYHTLVLLFGCLVLLCPDVGCGSWYRESHHPQHDPGHEGGSRALGKPGDPYFLLDNTGHGLNVTAVEGRKTHLDCAVGELRDRQVSWIRKERHPVVLSSGLVAFTSDNRVSVSNPPGSQIWRLSIEGVRVSDSGHYECQVNTEPKINLGYYLRVVPATAVIQGEKSVYVKPGSSISLTCIISLYSVPPATIQWYRAGRLLNLGSARGGVSLENEKTPQFTRSTLLVTRASADDSGNYTCLPSSGHPDSVAVHVLDGENPRAMQRGDVSSAMPSQQRHLTGILATIIASCTVAFHF